MATNNKDDFSNPIAISQGGTNASTMATSDGVVYFDGTRLVTTGAGTAGQVLTSNGAGVAPTFQSSGGGSAWQLLQSQFVNSSPLAVNFTTGITGSFNTYKLVITDFQSQFVGTTPGIQYSINGGSSYVTSGYTSSALTFRSGPPGIPVTAGAFTNRALVISNLNSGGSFDGAFNATIYLFNVTSGLQCYTAGQSTTWLSAMQFTYATMGNSSPINAFRLINGNGTNGLNGTFSLYGLNE